MEVAKEPWHESAGSVWKWVNGLAQNYIISIAKALEITVIWYWVIEVSRVL